MNKIILASQSPRRKQLLEWAEVPFEIIVRETDESYPPDLEIKEVPVHIARNKALAVRHELKKRELPSQTILAADTIVVLGDKVIGKPENRDHAIEILTSLAGNTHQVITGVVIQYDDQSEVAFSDITEVDFHDLSPEQISFYVDKFKPYDKAGAYAIQEWIGVTGIRSIRGDFYNVMGLPVSRVVKILTNSR